MSMDLRQARSDEIDVFLGRQVACYATEFAYGPPFARHVAKSAAEFRHHHDPARDRVWIAEHEGGQAGAIAIMHDADRPGWAKLRWFFVEAEARGMGIGSRLIDEALAFAGRAGYEGVHFWTCSDLTAAARQYARAGFHIVEEAPCPWKDGVVQQRWEKR